MLKKLKYFGEVSENVDIKELTTFKVGGLAKYLVKPESPSDVKDLIEFLKENNIKYYVIGNGSNIIFSDADYDGVIIKLENMNAMEIYPAINSAFAEAGAMMPNFAKATIEEGLTGLEWAVGLPATVGGCVVTNAGCYKSETFDVLKSVTVIDPEGNLKKIDKNDIKHGYRTTEFKTDKRWTILVAEFQLTKGDINEMKELVDDRRQRRLRDQPLDFPSAGSVFRNPEGDFAGRLIEECGLKGHIIGGAEISSKHANFIVNKNNATAKDIKELIDLAHSEVLKKFNIDLIVEQEFVNWE